MSLSYGDVASRLLRFKNRDLGSGATEDEIRKLERALGVNVHGGYRQFLKQFGWGGVEHLELYGIGTGVPPHLSLIAITKSERQEMAPSLQRHLLPVMNDGFGNLYCIDTRAGAEPPVLFWDHTSSSNQKPDHDADDFASWLNEQLDAIR